MHVDILISTYDRLELLRRCIKSIMDSDYKDVSIFVVVDGNKSLFDKLLGEPVTMILNEKRMGYVFSMNRALRERGESDAVLYASDDLIFWPNCISNAVKAMKEHFPDTDGLVALKQAQKESGTAFGLLGRKFINRFPDDAVFCPDYIHYGCDEELEKAARRLEQLYQCREAIVSHSRLHDKTYNLAQEARARDREIRRMRKKRRFCWGINFERIRE